jgi:hypothetical protein
MSRWSDAFRQTEQGDTVGSVDLVDAGRITAAPNIRPADASPVIRDADTVDRVDIVGQERVADKLCRPHNVNTVNSVTLENTAKSSTPAHSVDSVNSVTLENDDPSWATYTVNRVNGVTLTNTDRCTICSKRGEPGELLPFGVGPHTWLHVACWPGWFRSQADPAAWWAEVQAGLQRLPRRGP